MIVVFFLRRLAVLWVVCGSVAMAQQAVETDLYDWQTERCSRWDIPDTPLRAWKDADGLVRAVSGSEESRASVGNTFEELRRQCRVLHHGAHDADPARRDDRVWIASIFTRDGLKVSALGHAEYHGHRHPNACESTVYKPCWRNAIVALTSDDGGQTFRRGEPYTIAALPYVYDPAQTRRSGFFNPSNMIEEDGFVYVFFLAERYRAQKRGVCALRRPVDGDNTTWRAWDGQQFTRTLIDPYIEHTSAPEDHVCEPLPGLTASLTSVIYQPATGRYLAVSPHVGQDIAGQRRSGVWAYQSDDLIHWDNVGLVLEQPLLWARDCSADAVYAYPALIDPDSQDRMFNTVDDAFWLTMVRMPLNRECGVGPERDLVRVNVLWPARRYAVPTLQKTAP